MKTAITLDEWRQAIEETCRVEADLVPLGWLTAIQFAQMMGYGSTAASRDLRILRESGKVETKKFLIRSGDRTLTVTHYRLKKK